MPKSKHRQLKAIYAMKSIEGFAMSLVGIFIPIFLLTQGYSVRQVILFFIIHYALLPPLSFLAIYVARRINLQRTMMLRLPFLYAYLLLLYLLPQFNISPYIVAVLMSFSSAFYWIPLHILFSRNTGRKDIGSATGKLLALPEIFGLAGPLFGGLIAARFGFPALMLLVFAIMMLSILPVLMTGSWRASFSFGGRAFGPTMIGATASTVWHHITDSFSRRSEFKFDPRTGLKLYRRHRKYFWAEIFDNMGEEVEGMIWPVFVYLSLMNIKAVGYAGTLLAAGSFLFTLFIGRVADKKGNKKKLIRLGGAFFIALWCVRYFADSEFMIYSFTLLAGIVSVIYLVPYTARLYSLPGKNETDEFFVFREIPVAIGRLAILLLAYFLAGNLNLLFPLAGAAYIYFLFF